MGYNFNSYQTELTDELLKSLHKETRADIIEYLEHIPFLQHMSDPNRPYAKDVEKDEDGKIIVNITAPHILEDMDYFRPAALYYKKHGVYTHIYPSKAPNGPYRRYWKEEARRCREGYVRESDGEWISGYYYFYLNYSVIQKVLTKEGSKRADRVTDFPNVYDGDYLFFHYLEAARNAGKHTATLKKRGSGFEQPYSEEVITPYGISTVGDMSVGDYLISREGNKTKILKIFEQGEKDVYEVELLDGRKVKCGINHLWEVLNTKNKKMIVTTEYLLKNGLKSNNNVKKDSYKYKIPLNKPVKYDTVSNIIIKPYTLGVMLGDGTISSKGLRISSNDFEIIAELRKENPDYNINKLNDDEYRYSFTSKTKGFSRLTREFKKLNLLDKNTYNKFIPDEYKYGSVKDRLELVKGLLDTDGTSSPNGSVRFTNTSEQLIDDLSFILRSLGYRVKKSKTNQGGKVVKFNNGCSSIQKECWILNIITEDNLFKLSRKSKNIKIRNYNTSVIPIKNIIKLNYKENSRCFLVDNDEHLYLTKDFIVTHNSFKGGSKLARNFITGESMEATNNVKSYAIADEKEFLTKDGVLNKFIDIADFLAETTPFPGYRGLKNSWQEMHWKMGYKDKILQIDKGVKNEIFGVTLKNDPEKARGKRGALIEWEEAGKFNSFLRAWQIARPSVEEDGFAFGLMNAYGTGGTEGADFFGLQEIFYNPLGYNILGLPNVYDKNVGEGTKCSFFFATYMNANGFYDKDGNSDVIGATLYRLKEKLIVKYETSDPNAVVQYMAENPITPQDAIMRTEGSRFPIMQLKNHLSEIMPNLESFCSSHFIGELKLNKSGELELDMMGDYNPVRKFPLTDNKNKQGCLEIFEKPIARADGTIPRGRYIAGCLTPGEKVMTDKGLMNVEDVKLTNKLINDKGDLVNIFNLQRYYLEDETTYNLKVSNTYRKTNFTSEHPILVSDDKTRYISYPKSKRLGIPQRYKDFNFEYKTVDKVKVGNWIKVPNIYIKENDFNIEDLWINDNTRIDRMIDNPLLLKDFWWFVGLWLGDGWCENNKTKISIALNTKEISTILKLQDVIYNIFGRSASTRTRNNCVEVSFSSSQLHMFLNNNFGKYADGKLLPEWSKRISKDLKLQLIQGYLDSDGSIIKKNNNYTTEFVSINLELLESIQDILFSLNIVSSLNKLRDEQTSYVLNKSCNIKDTYHLRLNTNDTITLASQLDINSEKVSRIDFDNLSITRRKPQRDCFIDDSNEFIYFQIKDIEHSSYTGTVYNFECDTHTFMCHHITTHNCDPYDDDESTTNSLGSLFVFDVITDRIVAEYTGRPDTAKEFYKNIHYILKYYNAICNYENDKKGLYAYMENHGGLHHLADNPQILKDMEVMKPNYYGNKAKGTNSGKQINRFGRSLLADWMLDEAYRTESEAVDEEGNPISDAVPNLFMIRSIGLINEAIAWNIEGNYDRISAMGMLMILREDRAKIEVSIGKQKINNIANDKFFNSHFAQFNHNR